MKTSRFSRNDTVGSFFESSVRQHYRNLGFNVAEHEVASQGADLYAINPKDGKLIVGEVLNWKRGCYIHSRRWRSIVRNLLNPQASERRLFTTFPFLSASQLQDAKNLKIEVKDLDYQVLAYQQPIDEDLQNKPANPPCIQKAVVALAKSALTLLKSSSRFFSSAFKPLFCAFSARFLRDFRRLPVDSS
jgi:hypothetical protein